MHLITLIETHPSRVQKFIDTVKNWKFYVTNNRGEKTPSPPTVTKVELFDIKIQSSVLKEFMDKIFVFESAVDDVGNVHKNVNGEVLEKISKYLRMFTPLKKVKHSNLIRREIEKEIFKEHGWVYAYVLGSIEDEKNEEGLDII